MGFEFFSKIKIIKSQIKLWNSLVPNFLLKIRMQLMSYDKFMSTIYNMDLTQIYLSPSLGRIKEDLLASKAKLTFDLKEIL